MLSILVPIYNFNCIAFATSLSTQLKATNLPGEILFIDDASDPSYQNVNLKIAQIEYADYQQLDQNIGRSAIRNLLASQAKFDYLLFLDGDSGIFKGDFISTYLNCMPFEKKVICGGRVYPETCPGAPYLLHWKYGTNVEAKSRHIFQSNNFLIRKSDFNQIEFEERHKGYGHEDSLFGQWLEKTEIKIRFINNPVIHMGLESSDIFLRKQEEALRNLKKLAETYNLETRITRIAGYFQLPVLKGAVKRTFIFFKGLLRKNLLGKNPSLLFFNIYKLGYYLSLD